MATNMFTTRTMLKAMEQSFQPTTFLRDLFFSNVVEFDTAVVDIDIEVGGETVAPYVHPTIGGKVIDREGYQTKTYSPPEVSPERVTTAEDLLNRQPGEAIYSTRSPDERAAIQLAKDLSFLDATITRREEQQAAEALFTGQVTVKGDGYDEVVRYWPANPSEAPFTQLTGGQRWSEQTADIIGDLEEALDSISAGSGLSGNIAVLGADAYKMLLAHEKTAKQLDNRRINLGEINPALPGMQGQRYVGNLNGVPLFTYNRTYRDPVTGQRVPYVPRTRVLVAATDARTTMAYGACALFAEDRPEIIVAARRVPDSWKQRKNPAGRIVQIKSRPLAIINQIDGFHVLDVGGGA